jgi:hypothetical protein
MRRFETLHGLMCLDLPLIALMQTHSDCPADGLGMWGSPGDPLGGLDPSHCPKPGKTERS